MLHTENNINSKADHFQSMLKALSMFKIIIWYDETIANKIVLDADGINYINSGKTIGCLLVSQMIENFFTSFATIILFHHVGLSWIVQSKTSVLIFNTTVLLGYLINHGITIRYVHDCMVLYLNNML